MGYGKDYDHPETASEARSRSHAEEGPTEEDRKTGHYSKPGSGPSLTSLFLGLFTGKDNK